MDYTWGRQHTFHDGCDGSVAHVEFTEPFSASLRGPLAARVVEAGRGVGRGVYGVMQGPRLETAAEIDRLERDGCTMVGMTAMPEAALARELGLEYAICAIVVNYAAGRGQSGSIHEQIGISLASGMQAARETLTEVVPALAQGTRTV